MSEVKALRIDFRKINKRCVGCDAPSEVIRVLQATDGEVYCVTFCGYCNEKDQQAIEDAGELENVSGTGTFINTKLYDAMVASGGISQLHEAVEEAMAGGEEDDDDDRTLN